MVAASCMASGAGGRCKERANTHGGGGVLVEVAARHGDSRSFLDICRPVRVNGASLQGHQPPGAVSVARWWRQFPCHT